MGLKRLTFYFILFSFALLPSLSTGNILFQENVRVLLMKLTGTEMGMTVFFILSAVSMALALTPSTFIAAVSGYFYAWIYFPFLVISYLIAAIIGFKFGKKIAFISFERRSDIYPGKYIAKLQSLEQHPVLVVFFARLSPALPFAMTNIALSAMNISWKNYLWGSLLGMLPRTFLFFWIGKNSKAIWETVKDPLKEENFVWIIVLFFVVSAMGIIYLIRKKSD